MSDEIISMGIVCRACFQQMAGEAGGYPSCINKECPCFEEWRRVDAEHRKEPIAKRVDK